MNHGRVVIFAGSPADKAHVEAIARALGEFGIPFVVRIASAHKTPKRLLEAIGEYDAELIPTVYVTVAGRSNALSGLVDAATQCPVLVCPPPSEQWAAHDIWSSLRMPSGVAPALVLDPANVALFAAKLLALGEPELRERIRQFQARNAARLVEEDEKIVSEARQAGNPAVREIRT
jgi:5-(carboxyamino)imidazole ribonucleotide mutase/phosphoribosylaminoimidazole-succinocarboxamide synthase